jgi:RNA polymerase sigma-B factor
MPATDEDLDRAAMAYAGQVACAAPAEQGVLRERLTEQCLPFAGRLARRYRGRGEPLEDLEQVARLGLVKAVDRYDPARGSFTAYAVITITGELKRHFRDGTWSVHVPRKLQDLGLEVGHAATLLTSTLARTPTVTELADRLHVSEGAVLEAMESAAGYTSASLNAPVGDGDAAELGDLFGGADRELDLVDDRLTVAELLLRLPPRERRILALRFYGNRTQAEIAADLGISQMHVSRLLSRALGWLREAMLSDAPPPWDVGGSPDGPGMRVAVTQSSGVLTVHVSGEVDRDTAGRLRTGLRHAVELAGPDRVVIDLSGVPLIDAAGMAVLTDAAVPVTGARPYVARILAVAGLHQ